MFIDGYLALCSATGAGTATELTAAGYGRQPIAFGDPENGISFSTIPYAFGMGVRGAVGRAVYDAPTGGNLLLVLPFPIQPATGRLPWDSGDRGHLRLFFTALQNLSRGGSYTGRITAGAMAGLCSDMYDVVNQTDIGQVMGQVRPLINTATMTAGVALSVARGVLQASIAVPAGTE